jgi:hypothetical protein
MRQVTRQAPPVVSILCSGFGLGFYIPGLLIRDKLRHLGFSVKTEVFEILLTADTIDKFEQGRRACSENFKLAIASQKVPVDIRESIDEEAAESLLQSWAADNVRQFIVLSGHWVHMLDRYRARQPDVSIQADLLYLDADLAPSWNNLRKLKPDYAEPYRSIRLYDAAALTPIFSIVSNGGPPKGFSERGGRLVAHGGGWGLGTFRDYILPIEAAGYEVGVACYGRPDAAAAGSRHYYMDSPEWRTWHRDKNGEHGFPPFADISADTPPAFAEQFASTGVYGLIRDAFAIVSKPGAGTLIDSLGAATPLIMLEPFGRHEQKNADVWRHCGFGVDYREWAAAGFSRDILAEMHVRLLRQRSIAIDYARYHLDSVLGPERPII